MAEIAEIASLDTGPLQPKQLSDREWQIIFEIERRLAEPLPREPNRERVRRTRSREFNPPHLAQAENRYQRVLLLDGGRGTGKTSILLTLIKRWHGAADAAGERWELDEVDKARINALRGEDSRIPEDGATPANIRVISNLDFDPLPREMPLVAGIVQAWRPTVERYDELTYPNDELAASDDSSRLMDLWHSLFRVAAVGWSDVSKTKGLIEQVLDREEQVRDWQHLREQWVWFVDHVIRVGRSLRGDDQLADDPVFVIVIDDVDLQVGRIRELLPALRLLTHPNVFFLVAADQDHMLDMLRLDFLGQQRKLIRESQSRESSSVDIERWANELAKSAFEKVFPRRNRWTLTKLTLSDFLSYPRHVAVRVEPRDGTKSPLRRSAPLDANFRTLLNLMRSGRRGAGDALSDLANAAAGAAVELPVMTYRTAQQLRHAVLGLNQPAPRVAQILTEVVSAAGEFDVRTTPAGIEVLAVGELGAFYRPTLVESGGYNTVVSGRPRFTFIEHGKEARLWGPDSSEELTAGLVAKALQEQGFAIDATGLKWETFLSFAWTEWPKVGASFAWSRHKHPRPDEMFAQTREWAEFLQSVIETRRKLERFAYAWIYYQRKWSGHRLDAALDLAQTKNRDARLDWAGVLEFPQPKAGTEASDDTKKWKEETLPLLARPELGFPPDIQSRLLVHVEGASDAVKVELKRQRRRLATDALFAAGLQRGDVNRMAEDDEVERVIDSIDKAYGSLHPKPSPWRMIEAVPDVVERSEQDSD
ncbi:MAG TPA: hypothetical protein VGF69_14285 [Thermoanaerobaculia bacterium]|jgi:hypothetical protein